MEFVSLHRFWTDLWRGIDSISRMLLKASIIFKYVSEFQLWEGGVQTFVSLSLVCNHWKKNSKKKKSINHVLTKLGISVLLNHSLRWSIVICNIDPGYMKILSEDICSYILRHSQLNTLFRLCEREKATILGLSQGKQHVWTICVSFEDLQRQCH